MSSDAKQETMMTEEKPAENPVEKPAEKPATKLKTVLFLQLLLAFSSFGGVCSKMAAGHPFLSFGFCLFYGLLILNLGIYAICWQQIIKRLPLTFAYANRAIGVVWGMLWGFVFFGEGVTPKKILGAAIVITGIVLYSFWGNNEQD